MEEAAMSKWSAVKAAVVGSLILVVGCLVSLALGGTSLATEENAPTRQDAPFCGPQWNLFPGADLGSGRGNLTSVAFVTPNDVWAVGQYFTDKNEGEPLIEHWDGQVWTRLPGRGVLHAVAAAGPGNVWAVGLNTIQHWNGRDWQEARLVISPTNATYELYGVAVASANDAWSVGTLRTRAGMGFSSQFLTLHWDGTQWTQVPAPAADTQAPLRSVAITRPNEAWAVGGQTILRWDGTAWHIVPSPPLPGFEGNGLVALAATASDDIWAVGSGWEPPPTPAPNVAPGPNFPVIEHWDGREWRLVDAPNPGLGGQLTGVAAAGPHDVLAVGSYTPSARGPADQTLVLHWDGSLWSQVAGLNFDTAINRFGAVAAEGSGSFWAVGSAVYGNYYPERPLIARYSGVLCWQPTPLPPAPPTAPASPLPTGSPTPPGLPPLPLPSSGLPTTQVADPHLPGVLYFPIVGHSLQGGFRVYWEGHGGLDQFGYPITEEFHEYDQAKGTDTTVQYFERARLEWHPENRPPYDILLGLLGRTVAAGREAEAPFQPQPAPFPPTWRYFPETGHVIAPELATYWETHGGLPIYGYPISNPFTEVNQADGKPYLVQYFERNRLEYHPELPEAYRVSLGLLGTEVLRRQGWLP
jgi:hypothetical protein